MIDFYDQVAYEYDEPYDEYWKNYYDFFKTAGERNMVMKRLDMKVYVLFWIEDHSNHGDKLVKEVR